MSVENESVHENMQEYHYCDSNAARNHSCFDFVITLHLRCYAATSLLLVWRHEHFRQPRPVPIELVGVAHFKGLAYGGEIPSAHRAKLDLITLTRATPRAGHWTLLPRNALNTKSVGFKFIATSILGWDREVMYTNQSPGGIHWPKSVQMETHIDHLVVAAPSRAVGIQYVAERLGVTPELGGNHERMGTHNALLRLNDKMYLEVIAINPEASKPPRPRWFELDNAQFSEPRLVTWVGRTNDIYTTASRVSFGKIEAMSRGTLNWLISIPPDGQLPMNGAVPMLIQWLTNLHPSDTLNDSGCELLGLEIRHPAADEVSRILERIDFASPLVRCRKWLDGPPHLQATINTPNGVRQL
jgi:Glyoxalase-like domain